MKHTYLFLVGLLLASLLQSCGGSESAASNTEDPAETSSWKPADPVAATFSSSPVGVKGEEVSYRTDSTLLKGYMAQPENLDSKRPGILVIHEWWGHNQYARDRADMLAALGYVVLAVDMYGEGATASHPEDAGKFAGAIMSNMPEAEARFQAALEQLKSHPQVDADRIGAVGYCFGGSVALTMANAGYELDAVAALHAGVGLPIMPSAENKPSGKILVANGAADPFIPMESAAAWSKAMETAGADYTYLALEGAKHAFSDPGATEKGIEFGLPLEYNEAADRDSWLAIQQLFASAF